MPHCKCLRSALSVQQHLPGARVVCVFSRELENLNHWPMKVPVWSSAILCPFGFAQVVVGVDAVHDPHALPKFLASRCF